MSLRQLLSRRINLVIGTLMALGAVLLVVGGSLLRNIERGMTESFTSTLTGDLQIYSSQSKDEFVLFSLDGNTPQLAPLPSFPALRQRLEQVENVRAVIPSGVGEALFVGGNLTDLMFGRLRVAVREAQTDPTPERLARLASLKAHCQQIVKLLFSDLRKEQQVVDSRALSSELAAAAAAEGEAFWNDFDQDPERALEFLENRVSPMVVGNINVMLPHLGTDLDAFRAHFDRVKVVDGEYVPTGQRGLMLASHLYEERFKLRSARRLDKIRAARANGRSIASDPELQQWVSENQTQLRDILYQLDGTASEEVTVALRQVLGTPELALPQLLAGLLKTTDENFEERYRLFYQHVAPRLELYRVRVGDDLVLKSEGRNGYLRTLTVKLWGTFTFTGLENSDIARDISVMDLVSFRELYGYASAEDRAELEALSQQAGVVPLSRDAVESAIFQVGEEEEIIPVRDLDAAALLSGPGAQVPRAFDPKESEAGVVFNAIVLLEDPSRGVETLAALRRVSEAEGLNLTVVGWQKVAGFLGQFTQVAQLVLWVIVGVLFLVMGIVFNNATMIVTLQRTQEIGTFRAIGAQRGVVLMMVLLENLAVGAVFGLFGALVGLGILVQLREVGIPAGDPFLHFFFAGPRLYPSFSALDVVVPWLVVLLVSVVATGYPAWLAARVPPLRAMQASE